MTQTSLTDAMPILDRDAAQDELFELLIAQETGGPAHADRIGRAPRDGRLPLSFPQQRLWFLHEMGVAGNAYTIPMNVRLRGRVDRPAMAQALTEIVRRHEVLRTVFRSHDGEPEQHILPPDALSLPVADLSAMEEAAQSAAVDAAVNEHNAGSFDLQHGPILRAALLRLGPADHVLLLAVHHIAFDGWSVARFVDELSALYRAFRAGLPSPLNPMPVQYADFAAWQRQTLDGTAARHSIEYWRTQLANSMPVSMPIDLPRPQVLGFRGGSCAFSLPAEVLGALERLGRERGATLFMVLLAGFAVLLRRYSGETRVAIGTPVAGRDRSEIESLLGFFVNSVVMAVDLSEDPDFLTLVDRVRDTALDAFAHSNVPFEKLVEELQPERGLDRNPLFQVMFALQQSEAMAPNLALEGLAATPIPFAQITARFDLELHVWPAGGALHGICTYNLDLFTGPSVERMLSHLAALLHGAARDPLCSITKLPMVPAAEARALIAPAPNAGPRPTRCLHQMLADAVRQRPGDLALVFGDTRITLGDLDRRANRIAHLLRAHGVGTETLVSLCLDRGDAMIAAFLGVFKAGGCYLPIDAAEPPERLRFILRDSRATVHLTQTRHAHLFAQMPGTVLTLDTLAEDLAERPDTDPAIPAGPDNLAYIIYTSGSTGLPKGVEGRHGTIANLVAWHLHAHPHGALRTLQYAQYSFDIFFQELFTSWLAGGACYMVTEDMRQNMDALAAFIVQHRLERIFMPFTPLQYVIEILSREEAVPFLKHVTTAGEQLQATQAVRSFFAQNPQARLHNHYGPTECYVVCAHTLAADPQTWPDLPPVGRPVDHVQIAIVDQHMEVVPPGVAGEILLGGAQLSRGYRSRPAQTADSFIADPFQGGGARLYRTGDLGRRAADGTIEFLGRLDRQIKIRGFRIEPGEIEVTLTRHPSVKQALITTHRYSGFDTRLVAYVVGQPGVTPIEAELRAWLQSRLPRQMIPNSFVTLDALPLNVSGKIDRRALPTPEQSVAAPDENGPRFRSAREQAIAEIFTDLLHRETIGPHDNFFEMGGHSLLATRVVARLRATLGLEFPLVRLFETPTIAGIADWATQNEGAVAAERIPVLGAETAPASFAQRRLWLLDQLGTTGAAYLMPVNLRLDGALDPAALERSLDTVLRRHAILRTTICAQDGQPVQHIASPDPFSLTLADLSAYSQQERADRLAAFVAAANTTPFDLANQLPFRARLIRLASDSHVLLTTFHHVACDGWSVMVFFRELGVLYDAFHAGRPDPLPPLAIQYADYSAWQHRTLTPAAVAQHVAYWRPRLTGLAPMRLPTDHKRSAIEHFHGAGLRFVVEKPVADGLRTLAQAENTTLYMVLLAAYMILLHRFTGDERIAVGTPVANRDRDEVEGLIGFFVNSLVMTAELRPGETFRTLLAQVRQNVLGAFAHQGLPFETLVEALAPVRDLSRNPLFQVVFALQQPEAMAARLDLPGLDAEPLEAGEATARFDLEFHLWLRDGALQGLAAYDRDLFDPETIQTLIGSYQALLRTIAAGSTCTVATFPLAAPPAAAVADRATNPSACLHSRFAAIAHARAASTAITAGAETMSYAGLDARSNRLAQHLVSLGLPPGSPVAILMQRSADLPMAMLAVLKAGCAYLPLEPGQPTDRLRFLLADAAAPIILTDTATRSLIPVGAARVLVLDVPDALWIHESPTPPSRQAHPDDVAYIIYTSGSTGVPKGVQVTHANADRLFTATQPFFTFDSSDVWTCFHSAAFDFSVWEIWGALLHGGRLVIVPFTTAREPTAFLALLEREQVTVLNQTPSAFAQLGDAILAAPPSLALRWIVFGGEALDIASLRPWFDRFGERAPRLVNCYGITETTVHVTLRPLGSKDLDLPFPSPIGSPIPDLELRLLDADLNPVPDRALGEICIAGPGVARGYLNAPALTAARFVPDRFGAPGSRMYRSGDLGRRRAVGEIEYLGRIDSQVKLRGYRIETGEIASRLRTYPAIADAAVVLRTTAAGDPQLCAYIVPGTAQDAGAIDTQTQDWQRVFDQQLEREWRGDDPLFRLTGWLSSYDRRPIPASEMRAWAEGTVAQIRALAPRRVLEIGCGTGILLFRLAEHVESYHGIDFSAASLDHVRQQIAAHGPRFANVTLGHHAAQDLADLPLARYDTIIINSVMQYFPSLDTVLGVLRAALRLLQPGGAIYIGDVRDLRLAETFHASVARARNPGDAGAAQLLRQAREQAAGERELLIDPAFFTAIAAELPEIGAVALLSQRGRVENELNKYRFAVILRRESPGSAPCPLDAAGLTDADIAALLSGPPATRTLRGMPNARLAADLSFHRHLLGEEPRPRGVEIETIHELAGHFGYAVAVTPSTDDPASIDAWFQPGAGIALPWVPTGVTRPSHPLASVPTRRQALVEAIPAIRRDLAAWLPDYMVPAQFAVLDKLPLTLNGKLDTRALPAMDIAARGSRPARQAPGTLSEQAVATIFTELLGPGDFDIEDDFFALGGHSLLATRLCSRVRQQFKLELPLVRVFENPTIRALAATLDAELLATAGAGAHGPDEEDRISGEI